MPKHGGRGRRGPKRRRHGPPWHDFWHHGPPGHDPHEWRAAFEDFLGKAPEDHWMFGGRRFRPWQMGEAIFNPFVAMALSKGGGLLPLYVLHLIAEQPRYGNELMSAIEQRTGGAWGTNPGAIYPLLNELEAQNLINGEWDDPDRRTVRRYAITARGREEFERLKAVMQPKLEDAINVLNDILSDLTNSHEDTDTAENTADSTDRQPDSPTE